MYNRFFGQWPRNEDRTWIPCSHERIIFDLLVIIYDFLIEKMLYFAWHDFIYDVGMTTMNSQHVRKSLLKHGKISRIGEMSFTDY